MTLRIGHRALYVGLAASEPQACMRALVQAEFPEPGQGKTETRVNLRGSVPFFVAVVTMKAT